MPKYVYEVVDIDGTSYTGASKLVGYWLDEEQAVRAAAAVAEFDSWHAGYVHKHQLMDRDD